MTGSLKVTVIESAGPAPNAPSAGSVLATLGAASPAGPLQAGSPLDAPGVLATSAKSVPF